MSGAKQSIKFSSSGTITIGKVDFSTRTSGTWLTDRCMWRQNDGGKSVIGSGKWWCSVGIEVGGFEAIKADGVLFAGNVEVKEICHGTQL